VTQERSHSSLALAGLLAHPDLPAAADAKSLFAWASSLGCSAIQLDATAPTLRPRELDRSARRDLAASLRRHELSLTGLDLFIPPSHFTDAAHVDRAVAALHAAVEFASDLRSFLDNAAPTTTISLLFPAATPAGLLSDLHRHADRWGATLVDHAWPPRAGTDNAQPAAGIDPAAIILAGSKPVEAVLTLAGRIASARVNDLSSVGRVPAGTSGSFDLKDYLHALRAASFELPPIIDLKGLDNPAANAKRLANLLRPSELIP
jgi:sugar phosphate isomerase/epimerase